MEKLHDTDTQIIAVYCSGVRQVNGQYIRTGSRSAGKDVWRKKNENLGILMSNEGRWYISDCGNDFQPSGVDHLDYFVSDESTTDIPIETDWFLGDDGTLPLPKLKFLNSDSRLHALVSALRATGMQHFNSGRFPEALINLESVLELDAACLSDYVIIASCLIETQESDSAIQTLIELSMRNDLLDSDDGAPLYTIDDRTQVSTLLLKLFDISKMSSVADFIRVLEVKSLYRFVEFVFTVGEALKSVLQLGALRAEFQVSGGVEIAMAFRDLYRNIEQVTFDTRDTAVSRMKAFSLADAFRQLSGDGKLDERGRDATFKIFWEAGTRVDIPKEIDPKELESRTKDLDPAKEMKCSVIKNISEGVDVDRKTYDNIRTRLLQGINHQFSLEEINQHDCNNTQLKLISIHGVVFDVTDNLEKYAPDGEYFFFPGHDISYPLAVSSLSGDHVDKLYRLEDVNHLKRVYGWMEYFEKKYKVVGRMAEYADEANWALPPVGDDEPEMQCCIM
jgi:hypothetical protein